MPTIVTSTDFRGKLFIPNTMDVPDIQASYNMGSATNGNKLDDFIAKYEKLLLVNALGVEQYNTLIANKDQSSGIWHDLINGTDYDNKSFLGLKDIITHYVYVAFLKADNAQYNTTGIERSKAANSVAVNPVYRLIDVWNEFVNMYQSESDCCCSSLYRLFYWDYWGYYNENPSTFVSLYKFLYDNQTDYSIGYFQFYRTQNVLGI